MQALTFSREKWFLIKSSPTALCHPCHALFLQRHPLELLFIYTTVIDFAIRPAIFPCQFDFHSFFLGYSVPKVYKQEPFSTVQVKRGMLIKAYYSLSFLHEPKLVTFEPFILFTREVTTQATKLIRINTHNHFLSTSSQFKPYFAPTCLSKAATLNALHEFLFCELQTVSRVAHIHLC